MMDPNRPTRIEAVRAIYSAFLDLGFAIIFRAFGGAAPCDVCGLGPAEPCDCPPSQASDEETQ